MYHIDDYWNMTKHYNKACEIWVNLEQVNLAKIKFVYYALSYHLEIEFIVNPQQSNRDLMGKIAWQLNKKLGGRVPLSYCSCRASGTKFYLSCLYSVTVQIEKGFGCYHGGSYRSVI